MTEQRRFAAILVADVVGYSKLVGSDEAETAEPEVGTAGAWLSPTPERPRSSAPMGKRTHSSRPWPVTL